MPQHFRSCRLLALAVLVPLFAGCLADRHMTGERPLTPMPVGPGLPPPSVLEGPFVPIYRNPAPGAISQPLRQGGPDDSPVSRTTSAPDETRAEEDFYLAINKKELGQRWFLSSFLRQSDFGEHSWSMGTDVVSFKVQNGKLFIFRAEKDLAPSEAIQPEFIIEAYPLVSGVETFEKIGNASDYVLFDPAAGLNRFTVLGENEFNININLVFSQKFRSISDGVTFEQVWSGTFTEAGKPPEKLAGTLALAMRRYAEGEGFKPMPLPKTPFFFNSTPRVVQDQGTKTAYAIKWNVRAGGKPIQWVISGLAEKIRSQPHLAEFDFLSAIKTGIESWNQVFGFRALEARPAKDGEDPGQDNVNYFIFDTDRAADSAYAQFRPNPNTGEIRGASVYFPIGLIEGDIPPPGATEEQIQPVGASEVPPGLARASTGDQARKILTWSGAPMASACDLGLNSLERLKRQAASGESQGISRKDFVERYVAAIAAHEIGHTLGLRHNFKGSLLQPSSSVMEYLPTLEMVEMGPSPGSYDVEAIRYLYGLSEAAPRTPFCTDEQTNLDPECRRFDKGTMPLVQYYIPWYGAVAALFLQGALPPKLIVFVDEIVPHVRVAADPGAREAAYKAAVAPLKLPVGPMVKAEIRDFLTREVLQRLFVRPLPASSTVPKELTAARRPTEPVLAAAVADIKSFLIDADGSRSMAIRRESADLLQAFQHASGYAALMEARDTVAAKLPMLTGNTAIETTDLLKRIQRHLDMYFN
jgi:hypothetical protein